MNEIVSEKIEIKVDETLSKQLRFIGIIQQIVGVLGIISGGMMCLTIIGAAAGVPYIIGALNIFKAGGFLGDTSRNNSGESMREAISGIAKGLKMLLIGFVVWIILYFLFIIIIMIIGVVAGSRGY